MIVDDHGDIVETLQTIVEKEGHETETASNGEEFLKKIDAFNPDLVLLDVMMPGLTTKQILEKLKEKGRSDQKIILVTVVRFSGEEEKALFKDFKIADYVTKPFDLFEMTDKIRRHLGGKK
jgi:DNA-binding response OmpR family regulator